MMCIFPALKSFDAFSVSPYTQLGRATAGMWTDASLYRADAYSIVCRCCVFFEVLLPWNKIQNYLIKCWSCYTPDCFLLIPPPALLLFLFFFVFFLLSIFSSPSPFFLFLTELQKNRGSIQGTPVTKSAYSSNILRCSIPSCARPCSYPVVPSLYPTSGYLFKSIFRYKTKM